MRPMTKPEWLLAIAIFFILFAVMGKMDFAEAERQEQEYCHNVKAKIWPDYNGNYGEICKE